MPPITPKANLLINYPHLPGFTLLSYQVRQDLEHCFELAVQVEATDNNEFVVQLDGKPLFLKAVQTTTDLDRQNIYDTLAAVFEPVAPLPPLPKQEKIEAEWMHCHCSGE